MRRESHHTKELVKFDAVIIDTDATARNRLKQAAMSVGQFGKVEIQTSLTDALSRFANGSTTDVVFVSGKFEGLADFIIKAKAIKQSEDAAFVIILGAKSQDSSTAAAAMLLGGDGLLFEPFSVDSLVEMTCLAEKVRKERGNAREKVALSSILAAILVQIDLIAGLKSAGRECGLAQKKLKEQCDNIRNLPPDSLQIYFEIAPDIFMGASLPPPLPKEVTYKGASKRIKQKGVSKSQALIV